MNNPIIQNRKYILNLVVFIAVCYINISTIFCQPDNPYGGISIRKGGSVQFYFNSFQKMDDGVSYNNWSRLYITYNDTSDLGVQSSDVNWYLTVKANTSQLDGETGEIMNLNVIEIKTSGGDANVNYTDDLSGDVILSTSEEIIVDSDFTNRNSEYTGYVDVTFRCGVSNAVSSYKPDFYVVDLIFTLYGD